MSIRLMSLVWEITWPTQSQLLVALKLADYANDDGSSIYPARASIARMAQCSESTVKNTLRAFRSCGLLHVVQEGGSGPKSTTVYAYNLPLLRSLSEAKAVLDGGADILIIPDELFPQTLEGKGSTVDPLLSTRGQSDDPKGSICPPKGSKALTPTHQYKNTNIESSARERAKKGFISGFEVKGAQATFAIRSTDASWRRWIDHLRERDPTSAERAELSGEIRCTARWPENGQLVSVTSDKGLTSLSKRMTGEVS